MTMAKKDEAINEQQVKEWIERGVKKLENLDCGQKKTIKKSCSSSGSCLWFLGFIGAAVYFIQQATTFGAGFIGVLKAIVWPAFLVYHLFGFLKL
jgi:hypothetical protein